MGYSARYHVASLAAVFLALAAGVLIGAEFGAGVLKGVTRDLESSLKGDLSEAEERIDALEAELDRERLFSEAVYPALVGDTLPGRRLAVVALGSRPDDLRNDILDALEPTGAKVTQLAVVREPPDAKALGDLLSGRRSPRPARARAALAARRAGTSLVEGTGLYEQALQPLLSSFSGQPTPVEGVIVVRNQPEGVGDDPEATEALESNFIDGLLAGGAPVVGVERTDADPSSIEFFDSQGLTTVDDIELTAGRVSMVYALRGAQGRFGVAQDAELVPPVLRRPGATSAP
ncbi:MAG: copper transporter [bacterium]